MDRSMHGQGTLWNLYDALNDLVIQDRFGFVRSPFIKATMKMIILQSRHKLDLNLNMVHLQLF